MNGKTGGGAAVVEEDGGGGDDGAAFEANIHRDGKTGFDDDAGKNAGDALVVFRRGVLESLF